MTKKSFKPFSNRTAITLSLMLSTFLSLVMMVGDLINKHDITQIKLTHLDIIWAYTVQFFSNTAIFYILYWFNFRVIQTTKAARKKLSIAFFGSLAVIILLSPVFSIVQISLMPYEIVSFDRFTTFHLLKNLIVLIIVLLSTILIQTWNQKQQTLLEIQKLVIDNIRNRYDALKNQVDPHFLFNSLNTLDGLIGYDDDKAHEYIQSLSSVFRYVIKNKEIMSLREELDFTESYCHLMKIRYGDSLQICYHIDEKYHAYYIMPISLQLLVENAVKHNTISNKYPLVMTIETTPHNTIRVKNNISPKTVVEIGAGVGLANLAERYTLLFQKEISITRNGIFSVEIPLIEQAEMDNKTIDKIDINNRQFC